MASQGLTLPAPRPLTLEPAPSASSAEGMNGGEGMFGPPQAWPVLGDPRFTCLLRHWAEGRSRVNGRPGLMMPRAAIDPVAIRGCLANVWLYQYLPDEDDFLCTLAGEAVNQAWGRSLKGQRISSFMSPAMLAQVPALYRRMMDIPAIQVSLRQISPAGGVEQSAERLVVPLSDTTGRPWGVFGLTLYYLSPQARMTDQAALPGHVVLYPCADLPDSPP